MATEMLTLKEKLTRRLKNAMTEKVCRVPHPEKIVFLILCYKADMAKVRPLDLFWQEEKQHTTSRNLVKNFQ